MSDSALARSATLQRLRDSFSVPTRWVSEMPRRRADATTAAHYGAGELAIVTPAAFTIEEAARRLGFRHRSTVYDLISRGELVACHLGRGSLRVPADALVDYLQRAVRRDRKHRLPCIGRARGESYDERDVLVAPLPLDGRSSAVTSGTVS